MSLQQEVIIRDGKIVGSPPIATPSVNKALVTDGNGNIVGSSVSKNTLEELNMLITDTTGQDIVDGLTALANAVKPDASDIPYDSSLSVKGKIDEKVSKAGDTMTGDLTVEKGSPRFNVDNNAVTLSTASNNGVSNTTYCGLSIRDSNDAQIGLLENIAGTDGTISTIVTARNMDTSGNAVSNSLQVIARKNGTMGYYVSNPAAFRGAINSSTASITRQSGVSSSVPIPQITRRGNEVIIHFAHQFPAGTYQQLYNVTPAPASEQHAVVAFGNNIIIMLLTTAGKIRFNSQQTISTTQYLIGQLVYLTDE